MDASHPPPALQFDAVTPGATGTSATTAAMACAGCQAVLADEYFDVNGHSVCRDCSTRLASHAETPRGAGVLGRAAALGIAAAVLGAVLYFLVLAVTGLEVGLVAIAIGYMVGYGVRLGTRGRGGRRFQVLALVLTYWAMGLAYSSLVVKELIQRSSARPAAEQGATSAPAETPASPLQADGDAGPPISLTTTLLTMIGLTFALPVMVIVQSMPGGIISAAIVAFGMMQAWRMTAAPQIQVLGPFRIGAAPDTRGG